MKKTRYHNIMRADIREFFNFSICQISEDMISRAREWGIDLEHLRKRKTEKVQIAGILRRNPRLLIIDRGASRAEAATEV